MNENAKDPSDWASLRIVPECSGVNLRWSRPRLLQVGTWTEGSADGTQLPQGAWGLSQNARQVASQGRPTGHSLASRPAADWAAWGPRPVSSRRSRLGLFTAQQLVLPRARTLKEKPGKNWTLLKP